MKRLLILGLLIALCILIGPVLAQVPALNVPCPATYNAALATCTAKDVVTTVKNVEVVASRCGSSTNDIDLRITATYESTADKRYDLGIFLSKDGGSVQGKSSDSGMAKECVGVAPQAKIHGEPPFEDLDPWGHSNTSTERDTCGDLSASLGPVEVTFEATVGCHFDPVTGDLSIPACRVWEQNANHKDSCTDPADAGTGSKCACSPFTVNLCAGVNCNDGNACTKDTCDSSTGRCVNADISASCDDKNACTADSCVPATGCVNADISASCDDKNACTADS